MHEDVISLLKKSNIKNIQSVARRGITHTAFTTKEIREVSAIENLELYMMRDEVQRSMTDASHAEMNSNYARAVGRRTEFLLKNFRAIHNEEHYQEILNNGKKKLILRFLMTPKEFVVENDSVKGMVFDQNRLEGGMDEQKAVISEELPTVSLDADIVIKSIGYRTTAMQGVPYDEKRGTIPHEFGCVVDSDKTPQIGLYVAGWAKRGPVGIIDATLRDAKETFGIIKHHLETQ